MKKIIFTTILLTRIFIHGFSASSDKDMTWESISVASCINDVYDMNKQLETMGGQLDYSNTKISASSAWKNDIENDGYLVLSDKGPNIENQWIRLNNVTFENGMIDIRLAITNAETIADSEQNYVKIAKDLSSMYTSGFVKLEFNISFYESGTNEPYVLHSMLRVGDVDTNQVTGTTSVVKAIYVTSKSNLEILNQGGGYLFTNSVDASPNDPNNWVIYDFGNTSSFDLIYGVNRLDSSIKDNVDGEYTQFDLRVKSEGGKITVNNVSENQEPVASAKFKIYNDGKWVDTIKTDEHGYAESKKVAPGTYTIKQTKIDQPYILNDNEYKVQVRVGENSENIGAKQLVVNNLMTGDLTIKTRNEEDGVVNGVRLAIYDMSSDFKIESNPTDVDGSVTIANLAYGDYYLTVSSSPTEYVQPSNQYKFKIDKPDQEVELQLMSKTNDNDNGGYITIRTNSAMGTRYYIYDENGDLVDVIVVDENGFGRSKLIPYGSYCIEGDGQSVCFNLTAEQSIQDFILDDENSSLETIEEKETDNQKNLTANSGSESNELCTVDCERDQDSAADNELVNLNSDQILDAFTSESLENGDSIRISDNFSSLNRVVYKVILVSAGVIVVILLLFLKKEKNE